MKVLKHITHSNCDCFIYINNILGWSKSDYSGMV